MPTMPLNLREKLLAQGARSLSDAELLAVFISSGTKQKSCQVLAHDLLHELGDLRTIITADYQQFQSIEGLGLAKFAQLQAALEISRRSDFISLQKELQLSNSQQTYAFLKKRLRDYKNETFAALFLDSQNRVIHYEELFSGTINAATIYTRPLIQRVLQLNAAAVILAHNHPSGLSDASQQDVSLTKRIEKALHLIDVKLLDHLVIGDNEVYSIYAEHKLICH